MNNRMSFRDFKQEVSKIANREDFRQNNHRLDELKFTSFDTFICLLKMGAEITQAMTASEYIYDMSVETTFPQIDIIPVSYTHLTLPTIYSV